VDVYIAMSFIAGILCKLILTYVAYCSYKGIGRWHVRKIISKHLASRVNKDPDMAVLRPGEQPVVVNQSFEHQAVNPYMDDVRTNNNTLYVATQDQTGNNGLGVQHGNGSEYYTYDDNDKTYVTRSDLTYDENLRTYVTRARDKHAVNKKLQNLKNRPLEDEYTYMSRDDIVGATRKEEGESSYQYEDGEDPYTSGRLEADEDSKINKTETSDYKSNYGSKKSNSTVIKNKNVTKLNKGGRRSDSGASTIRQRKKRKDSFTKSDRTYITNSQAKTEERSRRDRSATYVTQSQTEKSEYDPDKFNDNDNSQYQSKTRSPSDDRGRGDRGASQQITAQRDRYGNVIIKKSMSRAPVAMPKRSPSRSAIDEREEDDYYEYNSQAETSKRSRSRTDRSRTRSRDLSRDRNRDRDRSPTDRSRTDRTRSRRTRSSYRSRSRTDRSRTRTARSEDDTYDYRRDNSQANESYVSNSQADQNKSKNPKLNYNSRDGRVNLTDRSRSQTSRSRTERTEDIYETRYEDESSRRTRSRGRGRSGSYDSYDDRTYVTATAARSESDESTMRTRSRR